MTDEAKLRQQQARGDRARRILDDELVREAFEKIEAAIVEGWKGSASHEEEQRRNAYLMHRLFQNFRAEFTRAVTTGAAAGKELLRIQEASKLQRMIRNARR